MLSDRPSFVARISDDIPSLLLIYSAKPAGLARSHVTGETDDQALERKVDDGLLMIHR